MGSTRKVLEHAATVHYEYRVKSKSSSHTLSQVCDVCATPHGGFEEVCVRCGNILS